MSQKRLTKRIVAYELIGFGLLVLFLWLDELMDLPYFLFGAPATPINWRESLLESGLAVVLGVVVVVFTRLFMARIKYLEGFLIFCAGCKRIRYGGSWVPVDVFMRDHSDVSVSHGLCPECIELYCGGWTNMPPHMTTTDT